MHLPENIFESLAFNTFYVHLLINLMLNKSCSPECRANLAHLIMVEMAAAGVDELLN